jgi:ABC-type dipeptide/oligopeptide/nickel transport system permease subunit
MAQAIPLPTRGQSLTTARSRSPWRQIAYRVSRNIPGVFGFIIIVAFFLTAILAPWLAPYPFDKQDLANYEKPPSAQHWFGTDQLGRDMLSRVIYGARSSAFVVILVTVVNLSFGIPLGAMAGYFRGWVDSLIVRTTEVLYAFPGLLFTLLIAATIRPAVLDWAKENGLGDIARTGYLDYAVVIMALGLVGWAGLARFVRGQVLAAKEREYVIGAQAIGAKTSRVITKHILPNALAPIIVSISMGMGFIALSEGYLSYLGIGLQPPNPSWGSIMADNAGRYWRTYPQAVWMIFIPGIIMTVIVLAFAFFGNALNEAMNPEIVE